MSDVNDGATEAGRSRNRFEPIASLTVHQTLRIVVQGDPETLQMNADVVSAAYRDGTSDIEDVVIRISDTSLAQSLEDNPIGYDWQDPGRISRVNRRVVLNHRLET